MEFHASRDGGLNFNGTTEELLALANSSDIVQRIFPDHHYGHSQRPPEILAIPSKQHLLPGSVDPTWQSNQMQGYTPPPTRFDPPVDIQAIPDPHPLLVLEQAKAELAAIERRKAQLAETEVVQPIQVSDQAPVPIQPIPGLVNHRTNPLVIEKKPNKLLLIGNLIGFLLIGVMVTYAITGKSVFDLGGGLIQMIHKPATTPPVKAPIPGASPAVSPVPVPPPAPPGQRQGSLHQNSNQSV
jgi:hypothetical protein